MNVHINKNILKNYNARKIEEQYKDIFKNVSELSWINNFDAIQFPKRWLSFRHKFL